MTILGLKIRESHGTIMIFHGPLSPLLSSTPIKPNTRKDLSSFREIPLPPIRSRNTIEKLVLARYEASEIVFPPLRSPSRSLSFHRQLEHPLFSLRDKRALIY